MQLGRFPRFVFGPLSYHWGCFLMSPGARPVNHLPPSPINCQRGSSLVRGPIEVEHDGSGRGWCRRWPVTVRFVMLAASRRVSQIHTDSRTSSGMLVMAPAMML